MVVREKGAVLIIILWILLAMSLLALSFSASIRTEFNVARNVIDQKRSYYLARAGIEYAVYKILGSQGFFLRAQKYKNSEMKASSAVLPNPLNLSFPDGKARVEIINETGKINLNLAPEHLIFNLLIMVGVEEMEANVITDSIGDWRDKDDINRPDGAESDYYLSLPEPYMPKNGLFDVSEELLLVRAVTPEIYYGVKTTTEIGEKIELYGLQKYFTTFTNIDRIDINSAPVAVLAAIPGIDYDIAVKMHSVTRVSPVTNVADIFEAIPEIGVDSAHYLSTTGSSTYTLISDGQLIDSSVISRIRCVVRIDGISQGSPRMLYWNESNLEM